LGSVSKRLLVCVQVLSPRCDMGSQKTKSKKAKEVSLGSRRDSAKLDSLNEVERALYESKDSASAVCTFYYYCFFSFSLHLC